MRRLPLIVAIALAGCAANREQMNARAAQENADSRSAAERAFLDGGYRLLSPQPARQTLILHGVNADCAQSVEHSPPPTIEVTVGSTHGQATFEAACAFATRQKKDLVVHLEGDPKDTLVTYVPPESSFAAHTSGAIVRYTLVPQVKEIRRGFEKGVSCCCSMEPPPHGDAQIEVVVGPYPATREEVVGYDTVAVHFCDSAAPQ